MRLLADEGVDKPIVDRLREEGFTVDYIIETHRGVDDDTILELANNRKAVLLTADKDFGELVYRLQRASYGVILLRLSGLAPAVKALITLTALQEHSAKLELAFTVITPDSIRIRRNEDK